MVRSWVRSNPLWPSISGGCSPTESKAEDKEEEAAAASQREKKRSRARERVKAVGIWLQTFCLSL